jgi:hypothetical protein
MVHAYAWLWTAEVKINSNILPRGEPIKPHRKSHVAYRYAFQPIGRYNNLAKPISLIHMKEKKKVMKEKHQQVF